MRVEDSAEEEDEEADEIEVDGDADTSSKRWFSERRISSRTPASSGSLKERVRETSGLFTPTRKENQDG